MLDVLPDPGFLSTGRTLLPIPEPAVDAGDGRRVTPAAISLTCGKPSKSPLGAARVEAIGAHAVEAT